MFLFAIRAYHFAGNMFQSRKSLGGFNLFNEINTLSACKYRKKNRNFAVGKKKSAFMVPILNVQRRGASILENYLPLKL